MEDLLENIVPQAGILNNAARHRFRSGESPSSRCRLYGFWGEHDVVNQAGAEGMDRLALTASQKTSEEVEAPNVDHAKKWNKELSSLEK